MEINEVLDLVEYALKYYKDDEYQVKFTMLDYYSITDINMEDLANIAHNNKRRALAIALREFRIEYYYLLTEVKLRQRMNCLYSFKGREMSNFDKLSLYETLVDRGYPVLNGVYDAACRYYTSDNLANLNKEDIQTKIKKAYCNAKGIPFYLETPSEKSFVKSLTK